MIASLTASYLISMFLVPVLAYMFFKPESEKKINKKSPVKNFFLKLLDTGLKHRKITIIAAFSTLIISVLLVIGMGIKFFPGSDKPVICLLYTSYFTSIITCCEAGKGKPAPDVYQHTAREIGVSPDECIAFEDTCEGVLSAKNAGMYVYAVADDAHIKYSDTIKENADKYIEGFSHFKCGLSSIKQFIFNDINSI